MKKVTEKQDNPSEQALLETRRHSVAIYHNCEKGFDMALRHSHIQYELMYIRQGRITIDNNGQQITVNAPYVVIHKPFTLHRAVADPAYVYDRYIINFDSDLISAYLRWTPGINKITENSLSMIRPDAESVLKLDSLCENALRSFEEEKYGKCELFLALILDTVCECPFEGARYLGGIENKYVSKAMNYINLHYGDNILIEDLAKQLFVSRAKLIADFKNYNGITIKQYIQLTRINYAKLMLLSGESITRTAQNCGFCDDSHFVYTFRHLVGMTPKAYVSESKALQS